jgi:MFS family permease
MAVALMQTLDITITNIALPTIQGNLGASADEGTWVATGYTIVFAGAPTAAVALNFQ